MCKFVIYFVEHKVFYDNNCLVILVCCISVYAECIQCNFVNHVVCCCRNLKTINIPFVVNNNL